MKCGGNHLVRSYARRRIDIGDADEGGGDGGDGGGGSTVLSKFSNPP